MQPLNEKFTLMSVFYLTKPPPESHLTLPSQAQVPPDPGDQPGREAESALGQGGAARGVRAAV